MIPSAGLPSILQRVTRMLLVMALLWALLMSAVVRQVVHHEVDELMDQSLRESAEILHRRGAGPRRSRRLPGRPRRRRRSRCTRPGR